MLQGEYAQLVSAADRVGPAVSIDFLEYSAVDGVHAVLASADFLNQTDLPVGHTIGDSCHYAKFKARQPFRRAVGGCNIYEKGSGLYGMVYGLCHIPGREFRRNLVPHKLDLADADGE